MMNLSRRLAKKLILTAGALAWVVVAAPAQTSQFLPGHLAVLRAGDGRVDLHLKQAPIFVDQYDREKFTAAPSFTVAIPTNGPNAFFFNGHAATEGNLARSADYTLLTFAGYCGVDLLQSNGTPSQIGIPRGICSLDASGAKCSVVYRGQGWYGKTNPRGVVTDGANNFWGCGNIDGVLYCNPVTTPEPRPIESFPNTRDIRIVSNALYASINGADAVNINIAPGVYDFTVDSKTCLPQPGQAAHMSLVLPAIVPYTKNVGFELNPEGTIAYMSDTAAGVQKYVKSNGAWKFAYNFVMPPAIPRDLNKGTGCFGLAVDFSGVAPVVYATTTEGYGNGVNSNRVVRITDTNSSAAVVTIAQAGSTNIAFRGIDFTPQSPARHP